MIRSRAGTVHAILSLLRSPFGNPSLSYPDDRGTLVARLQGRRAFMRRLVGPLAGVALVLAVPVPSAEGGAPAAVRFRVTPDLKAYPQGTAKEALASVLEAVKKKRIDYLLAQLTDPEWV